MKTCEAHSKQTGSRPALGWVCWVMLLSHVVELLSSSSSSCPYYWNQSSAFITFSTFIQFSGFCHVCFSPVSLSQHVLLLLFCSQSALWWIMILPSVFSALLAADRTMTSVRSARARATEKWLVSFTWNSLTLPGRVNSDGSVDAFCRNPVKSLMTEQT